MGDNKREASVTKLKGKSQATEEQNSHRSTIIAANKEPLKLIVDLTGSSKISRLDRTRMTRQHAEHVALLRQPVQFEREQEREKEVRRQARRWIGTRIRKEVGDDETRQGTITDFDVQTGLFKVRYEDQSQELMSKKEATQHLVEPQRLRSISEIMAASLPVETNTEANASNENFPKSLPVSAGRKRSGSAKKRSSYIPLALKETKRDAYYWYRP